jgi:hypothetical protein
MEEVFPDGGKGPLAALLQSLALWPATVNRMLALMKRIYNLAIREEMVERNPCFKVAMLLENNKRDRVMTGHKTTTIFDRYNTVDSGEARFAMDR